MYERLEQCPVCENKQFDNHMICDDHSVTGESFALVKCRNCKLVFTNPRPEKSNLFNYYKSAQYISHTDQANSLIHLLYKIIRTYTLKKKIALIRKINTAKGSILDYGCGTGNFVKAATDAGWQVFGYEPDKDARRVATSKNKSVILESLKKIPENLDVITAWHVLEHVADLKTTIMALKKKVKTGGHLFIAVPNHHSYDAEHYQENWAAYDVPRHLYHFNKNFMNFLIKKYKFTLIDIQPMKFDSYYVSMLSEKYKNGGNIMKALKIGYESNSKASKTKEYSSLIYITEKMKQLFYIIIFILFIDISFQNCANVGRPTGGSKDTIPPTLIYATPINGTTNFSDQVIKLEFSEYINADKLQQQLIITPGTDITYKSFVKKNKLIVKLDGKLKDSTTYNFNFANGVTDITEKNPAINLSLAFSTGSFIDSLSVEGSVEKLLTKEPGKNYVAGLYPLTDSLDYFADKPMYFTTANDSGIFKLNYIKKGNYKIISFDDDNGNFLLDPETESHGFLEAVIVLDSATILEPIRCILQNVKPIQLINARPVGRYVEIKFNKTI